MLVVINNYLAISHEYVLPMRPTRTKGACCKVISFEGRLLVNGAYRDLWTPTGMPSHELLKIAEATLSSIQPGNRMLAIFHRDNGILNKLFKVTDESVQKLRTIFPDTLILAALDLVDKNCGKQ